MDFLNIIDTLSPILDLTNRDYTNLHHIMISRLEFSKYDKIISIINNQPVLVNKESSVYTQDYENQQLEHVTAMIDNSLDDNKKYPMYINILDNSLVLDCLSPNYLAEYILDNKKLKYLFVPIIYTSNVDKNSHICLIVIDNISNKINLLDPNGSHTYFHTIDDLLDINSTYQINNMLSKYFDILKVFGIEYKFELLERLDNGNSLNKKYSNDNISDGHCMVLTLILVNIISRYDVKPEIAYEILSKLSDDERLYVITRYTTGVYSMIN